MSKDLDIIISWGQHIPFFNQGLDNYTCVSNADVASSSKRISGFRTNALAMAILCF